MRPGCMQRSTCRHGTRLVDLSSSSGAGVAALGLASEIGTGRPSLVCCSDMVVGAPMGAREAMGGDAACAFLVGDSEGAAAQILGSGSHAEELLDVWRGPEQQFARQWEERFAQQRLVPALASAFERCLAESGLAPSDLKRVAVDSGHRKVGGLFARAAGLQPDQLADDLSGSVGRAGAAHAGLLLAGLLDSAEPGDNLAVLSASDGASALIVQVTEHIGDHRPVHSVVDWIQSKRADVAYETYLKWREILPFEPPRRPDPPRPCRRRRCGVRNAGKYAFVGSRCRTCGAVNLPPQVVCVQCGAVRFDGRSAVRRCDCSGRHLHGRSSGILATAARGGGGGSITIRAVGSPANLPMSIPRKWRLGRSWR